MKNNFKETEISAIDFILPTSVAHGTSAKLGDLLNGADKAFSDLSERTSKGLAGVPFKHLIACLIKGVS